MKIVDDILAMYEIKCPVCSTMDVLYDDDFSWDNDSEICVFKCIECKEVLKASKPE